MRTPTYDPINGDVGALFPQNRSGVLPPTRTPMGGGPLTPDPMGAPQAPVGGPQPDMQRQALMQALQAKIAPAASKGAF